MDSELPGEVIQGVKTMAGIEALLILAVTTLHFTVVARRVGSDELVTDTKLFQFQLKERGFIGALRQEVVRKLGAIVRLDTFNRAWKSLNQMFKKYRRGIGTVLLKGLHKAPTGILINCSILIKPLSFSSIYKAYRRNKLHINLNTLTRVKHLLIGLGSVLWIGGLNGQKVFLTKETI